MFGLGFKGRKFGDIKVLDHEGDKKTEYWVTRIEFKEIVASVRVGTANVGDEDFCVGVFIECSKCGSDSRKNESYYTDNRDDGDSWCECTVPQIKGQTVPEELVAGRFNNYTFMRNSEPRGAAKDRMSVSLDSEHDLHFYKDADFDTLFGWLTGSAYDGLMVTREFEQAIADFIVSPKTPWHSTLKGAKK